MNGLKLDRASWPISEFCSYTGSCNFFLSVSDSGMNAGIRIRPNADDLKEIGPSFTERWNQHFANSPDKPISVMEHLVG
jgi:hypothetical protein